MDRGERGEGRGGEGERGEWERDERGEQISSRTYMHVNMTAILEFVRSKSIFSQCSDSDSESEW